MRNLTMVYPVKMEYVSKITIFGLKMMIKVVDKKIFLKFTFFVCGGISKKILVVCKWNFKPKISSTFHYDWVKQSWSDFSYIVFIPLILWSSWNSWASPLDCWKSIFNKKSILTSWFPGKIWICNLVWMPSLKFKSWLESRWGISSLEISLLSWKSWSWSFDCWFWNSPLPNVQKRYAILDCQKFLGSWMGWTGLLQGLQGGWYMWSESNGNLICYCLKKKIESGTRFW